MTTYKLLITGQIENPHYEQQYQEFKERNKYNYDMSMPYPSKQIEDRKLEVEITEEEFIAIKKAVLETFK